MGAKAHILISPSIICIILGIVESLYASIDRSYFVALVFRPFRHVNFVRLVCPLLTHDQTVCGAAIAESLEQYTFKVV